MLDIFGTLYYMITFLKDNSNMDTGPSRQELIKTANLLFVQLETSFVWMCCGEQFSQACSLLAFVGRGDGFWRDWVRSSNYFRAMQVHQVSN